MGFLSKTDEILLLAIWKLKGNAYGVKIKQHVSELTNKDWNYGTLYTSLDQLVKKRYLTKTIGEPTSVRGGRKKIYYSLTQDGLSVLRTELELNKKLWGGVSEYDFAKIK